MAERRVATGSRTSLDPAFVRDVVAEVSRAEAERPERRPGPATGRVLSHTFFLPADRFEASSVARIGRLASEHLRRYFPDFVTFAEALELAGFEHLPSADDRRLAVLAELEQDVLTVSPPQMGLFLASAAHRRVLAKLESAPVEDLRLDLGAVHGAERDAEADRLVAEIARARDEGDLPAGFGLQIEPPTPRTLAGSLAMIDRVLTGLAETEAGVPARFVVTLSGVESPSQVSAVVRGLAALETALDLADGALPVELVVESPRAILDSRGRSALPTLHDAAGPRLAAVHLGARGYAAACDLVADPFDSPLHAVLSHTLLAAFAETGVAVVDGSTTEPILGPVRQARGEPPLTDREHESNRRAVHQASKVLHDRVRRSMDLGIFRGWDSHASHLPARYGAVYAFYLEHLRDATLRLRRRVDAAAQATRSGRGVETEGGEELLRFFARGLACGALTEDEAAATGLTVAEIRTGSLRAVLGARHRRYLEEMGE